MKWLDYRSCPVNPSVIRLKGKVYAENWSNTSNGLRFDLLQSGRGASCIASRTPRGGGRYRGGSEITGDWKNHLGQCVTVHGKALNHKLGAYLEGDEYGIYVDLPDTHWPSGLYFGKGDGEQVTVTGTVVERNDVPVFIPNPNKPLVQSVPVPEGTDLEGASKRYVLESVEYQKSNNGG